MESKITTPFGRITKTVLSVIVPVLSMYLVWGAAVAVMAGLGSFHFHESAVNLILPLAVLFFMAAASFVTELFILYVDDGLAEIPALRFLLLVWTVLVAWGVHLLTVKGFKGHGVSGLSTANLIVFACVCATWMTPSLKKPAELVPVCAVVALADLFSVLAGPTKHLAKDIAAYYEKGMEGPPPFTDYILVKITVPGITAPMPLFGVSDWLILVFLCSAMARFGLSDSLLGQGIAGINKRKRLAFYFPVTVLGLAAAVLAAQMSGMFLPALPIMVFFFLCHGLWANQGMRSLDSREWRLIAVFSVVMLSVLAAALYLRS